MEALSRLSELLARLSEARGPSGREDEVRRIVVDEAKKHTSSIQVDSLGNVFAEINGEVDAPKVMVAAHMDEVGLVVKYVDPTGFLRFDLLGSIDPKVLPGQRVVIDGSRPLSGVIGAKPPHILDAESAKRPVEVADLFIDIGSSSGDEARRLQVEVGTTATFDVPFVDTGVGSMVIGKAFDDRAGCAASLMVLEGLAKEKGKANVVFTFTVQEEVGLRGASVAANRVNPDCAIVLETTVAADTLQVDRKDRVTEVGRGPAIRVMDSSMITQRKMLDYLKRTAEVLGAQYQMQFMSRGGTDAGRIHLSGRGVPTGVLATPCRYLHSPSLMLNLNDLEGLIRLTEAAVRGVERKDQFSLV